ncbi:endothelin-converting enzyme 1 [Rhipicephalus sanguineus]|nr:endothelin-converting enzyme 1 [Rhipicephalus sanguineus]
MSLVDHHVELLEVQKPLYWHEWNETVAAMRAITAETHARRAPDEVACVVSNLDDLTRELRKGMWLEFINVHFAPELTFDENDPVIVYDISTMTNVGNVFDNTSLDALSEVFSWLVIETYLGVIVRPYREYDAGDKAWLTETNCMSHTNSILGLLSVQQYHQRKFPTWRRESVDSFLKHIRTTWALNVEHAPWIDRHSRRLALKKVHALDTVLWPADEFYDRESSEALYAPFPDMDKPFTANLIETALARRRLVNDSHYADVYSKQMTLSPDLVAYKYHLNEVHVALAALNPPAYYDVGMYAITYGGLGSLYAKEVSKIYDSTGRLLNANGELLVSPFGEESTEYKEKLRCNATGRLPTYNYFVHVAGLETAYEAYRVAVPHDMRDYDYRLQALGEYDSDQVFFMTYCHVLCAPQADHRAREYCNVPLSNFRPFADAFHCPARSYMNPGKKCTLFATEKKQEVKYA